MEHKILYISKKSTLSDKYVALMQDKYEVEQRQITTKSLYREIVGVSLILIYVTSFSPEEAEELHSFLSIMPNSYIPVVLLGSATDIRIGKNELRYPIAAEFDASKRPFRLDDELKYLLRKLYPEKKAAASDTRDYIYIYNKSANICSRLNTLLGKDYRVVTSDSKRALFDAMGKEKANLILISYENSAPTNTEYLLAQLTQTESTSGIPIMIYGDYMSNDQKQRFLSFKVRGIMADSDAPEQTKDTIDKFFHKKMSGDDLFKLI